MYFNSSLCTPEMRSKWTAAPQPGLGDQWAKARDWCESNGSDSSFYFHYTKPNWWFENETDALLFTLTWTGR